MIYANIIFDKIGIQFSYNKINDTIDIFNIKATQINSSNYGSIGDANGFDLFVRYQLNSNITLSFIYESLNINYIDDKIRNRKNELILNTKLFDFNSSFFDSSFIDFGFIYNKSSDLDIKDDSTLNSLFDKIRPENNFYISDGTLSYNDKTVILFDQYVNKIYPFIKISNLKDYSFYTKFIIDKRFKNNKIDLYCGFKLTKISTSILLEPKDNSLLQDAINTLDIPSLNRDEVALFGGFLYGFEYKKYIFKSNYEYIRLFKRDSSLSYNNQNHILNITISRVINDKFSIFIGGKAMLNQFNSVIPYLYNRYTKTKYDKKYGYAKIGFSYNFNTI